MIHFIDTVLEPCAWILADWSVRWAVLIGLLAAVLHWGRLKRAATRYLLCAVVLCVGLLLPALPRWGPGLWSFAQEAPSAEAAPHDTASDALAIARTPSVEAPTEPQSAVARFVAPPARELDAATASVPAPERLGSEPLDVRRIALVALAAIWTAGAALFLLRLAGGWLVLARLRRRAIPVDGPARDLFEQCRRELRLRRRSAFAKHPAVASPITLGPWRPAVLVPAGWEKLSATAQRSGIVHELWHLRRRDDWTGIGVELVRTAFFFHPLVHWLLGRLYRERELLCDEAALAHGADPRDYARMLLDFARQPTLRPLGRGWLRKGRVIAALPTTPLGDRRTVKHRIDCLLDENAPRWMAPLPRGRAIALALATLAITVGMAGLRGRADIGAASIAKRSDPAASVDAPARDSRRAPNAEPLQQRPEVVAVLGDTRLSHWNRITAVAFSPDGQRLATSSADHTVVLWDAATGKARHTLQHDGVVTDVEFSPDGQTLASALGQSVVLWDVESGNATTTLADTERAFAHCVALSADGQKLATGGPGVVQVWDLATKQQIFSIDGHTDNDDGVRWGVADIAFSPNGTMVASASARANPDEDAANRLTDTDGVVKLWEASTGRELAALGGHNRRAMTVVFAPDGQTLFTSDQRGTIRLWDLERRTVTKELFGHEYRVGALGISSDGTMLASGGADHTVRIWDAKAGKNVRTIEGITGEINAVAFKPGTYILAVASQDKRVRFWDSATGKEGGPVESGADWPNSFAFSPDGRTLALGYRRGPVRLWDVRERRWRNTLVGHSDWVRTVAFTADGKRLVSRSDDHTVRTWDLATGRSVQISEGAAVTRAVLSPSGSLLAAMHKGTVELIETASGQVTRTLESESNRTDNAAFARDGKTLAVAQGESVSVWNIVSGERISTVKNPGHVSAVALSPDGSILAAGGLDYITDGQYRYATDCTMILWDVATGTQRAALKGPKTQYLWAVAFSTDGNTLASAAEDGTLWVWNAPEGTLRETVLLGPPGGRIYRLLFSPDGRHLATINGNGTVSIVRLGSGEEDGANGERGDNAAADRPDLATLIDALTRHEQAMQKVRLEVLLTFRPNLELTEKERTFFPWADGRKHQRRIELARDVANNRWHRKEAFLVDGTRAQQFDQYSDAERQHTVTQTSWNGLNPPRVRIAQEPEPASLAPDVTMLDGLFPTRRSLAAELSKAQKVDLAWDGDDARLSFSSSQRGYGKFDIWLSRTNGWYPQRLCRYGGREGELLYEWKVARFAESAGVVYPQRGQRDSHDRRVQGKSAYTVDFEVLDLAAAPALPVELFRYEIPDGARVRDDATGKSYIQGRTAPTEKKDFTLKVLDVDGNPIPGATAVLVPTESYPGGPEVAEASGKTDADGIASFGGVFKTDYQLTIRHPNYRPALWGVGAGSETLRAYLLPKTQGVAVDGEGKPVPGAHVTSELMFHARHSGGPLLNPPLPNHNTDLADEEGRFELVSENTIRSPERPLLVAAHAADATRMAIRFVAPADLGEPLELELLPTCRVRTVVELQAAGPDEVGSISIAWADAEGREFASYATRLSKTPDGGSRAEALARIPPGSYQLTFGRTALSEPVSVRFEVKPGETEKDLGTWSLRPSLAASLRGKAAPELAVQAWRPGDAKRLEDLRGNVVVLDFWGYWCGPCIEQMPGLMDLAEKFKERPVRWVAVHDASVKDFEELDAKLADVRQRLWNGRHLPFYTAIDEPVDNGHARGAGATAARYGVKLWPTLVLIDRDGNLVGTVSKDRLEAELHRLLGG